MNHDNRRKQTFLDDGNKIDNFFFFIKIDNNNSNVINDITKMRKQNEFIDVECGRQKRKNTNYSAQN